MNTLPFDIDELNILPLHPSIQYDSGEFSFADFSDILISIIGLVLCKSDIPDKFSHHDFINLKQEVFSAVVVTVEVCPGCYVILNPHIVLDHKTNILNSIGVVMGNDMLYIVCPDGFSGTYSNSTPEYIHSLGIISIFDCIVFRSNRWGKEPRAWMQIPPDYVKISTNPLSDIGDLFENYCLMENAN